MAVPKRRSSKQRSRTRRAQWKKKVVRGVECPECHESKLPHYVCGKCGYYKGRKVIDVKTAE
ncbi:MAG: 50S ribosomal protein L32 [Firmicutes bacterium]|nr:50S ribosomal protein L32 [Bacillota bacterium]